MFSSELAWNTCFCETQGVCDIMVQDFSYINETFLKKVKNIVMFLSHDDIIFYICNNYNFKKQIRPLVFLTNSTNLLTYVFQKIISLRDILICKIHH